MQADATRTKGLTYKIYIIKTKKHALHFFTKAHEPSSDAMAMATPDVLPSESAAPKP